MATYSHLKKEFEEKVARLQASCKHKRLTKWIEKQFIFGHGSGALARFCLKCDKEVYSKYEGAVCEQCGEINSWFTSHCLKCLEPLSGSKVITEKLGKIIKMETQVDKNG